MRSPYSSCVCVSPLMPESQNSETRRDMCVCMCIPLIVIRQQRSKHFPTAMNTYATVPQLACSPATNTRNNRRIVGCIIFYAIHVVSKKICVSVSVSLSLLLLGNNSVNTFPLQQRILGRIIFYTVYVISKESRQSVLPRTFCFYSL
jgi:hypothetical protein